MKLPKHLDLIFTVSATIGVIVTTLNAIHDTPKALKLIEEQERKRGACLTNVEKVKCAIPAYIPTITSGSVTIGCVFGNYSFSQKQQAGLIGAYSLLDASKKKYAKAANTIFGTDADQKIRAQISKEDRREQNVSAHSPETVIFYDEYSDRFFESTFEKVHDAEYHLNRNFALRGYSELNEFYEFLELEPTSYGATVGWGQIVGDTTYGYSWIDFYHEYVDDPYGDYYIIRAPFEPTADFLE